MMTEIEKQLHEYWEKRGPVYYVPDVFGRRIVAAYLVKLHPESLIEIGCGNGELFSAFQQIPRVLGVDWSDTMLKRAAERIARHEYKNIVLHKLDITQKEDVARFFDEIAFPYFDEMPSPCRTEKPFKIALTRTVLMHIAPDAIEAACKNLTLLSDNLVLMEWYWPGSETDLAWHNFQHEYVHIFKPLGYELVDSYDRPDGIHQILFHFRRTEVGKPGVPQGP